MYPEASDEKIAHAKHDRLAFGEIYDLYVGRVYAFCLSRTAEPQAAEDLTSQTFARAIPALARYESRGTPLSSWLLHIAANLVIDRGRSLSRVLAIEDRARADARLQESHEGPESTVERWERAAWLRAHIARLPPDQQEAIRLRYWEGYSTFDLAKTLNRSEGAVKQLLHRALTSLRESVGAEAAQCLGAIWTRMVWRSSCWTWVP